jgi:hypothetical protein
MGLVIVRGRLYHPDLTRVSMRACSSNRACPKLVPVRGGRVTGRKKVDASEQEEPRQENLEMDTPEYDLRQEYRIGRMGACYMIVGGAEGVFFFDRGGSGIFCVCRQPSVWASSTLFILLQIWLRDVCTAPLLCPLEPAQPERDSPNCPSPERRLTSFCRQPSSTRHPLGSLASLNRPTVLSLQESGPDFAHAPFFTPLLKQLPYRAVSP